jgi:hypothetical protein
VATSHTAETVSIVNELTVNRLFRRILRAFLDSSSLEVTDFCLTPYNAMQCTRWLMEAKRLDHCAYGICLVLSLGAWSGRSFAQEPSAQPQAQTAIGYLTLSSPRQVLPEAQKWEGKEFPHTMSVLEFKRGGFRYWGWYGLNEGGGIGLARSNDLLHWTKYEQNPLSVNARWPSVLAHADPAEKNKLLFALTRDYDTPNSYIVLASSKDGIHLKQEKVLVSAVPNQRNQNPNLFRDPRSGCFYLTFYRGNDHDHFEIISKSAPRVDQLDSAPEKLLLQSSETIAAPTLLYLKNTPAAGAAKSGLYYLATEVYPHRYTENPEGEWQVKVFVADAPDGTFRPVTANPIMRDQRACLFQHIFRNRFYGFDCHLDSPDHWVLEETEAPLPK